MRIIRARCETDSLSNYHHKSRFSRLDIFTHQEQIPSGLISHFNTQNPLYVPYPPPVTMDPHRHPARTGPPNLSSRAILT